MKYREFKDKILAWGNKHGINAGLIRCAFYAVIELSENEDNIVPTNMIVSISKEHRFVFELLPGYVSLPEDARGDLLKIIVAFAETKPNERE